MDAKEPALKSVPARIVTDCMYRKEDKETKRITGLRAVRKHNHGLVEIDPPRDRRRLQ